MSATNVENKAADASAITDVANTLANTHIDKADAVLASAAEGRRLYIGNLAYATKEVELKDFFKDFLVESVSIPKNPRTDKPVGYAFVDVSAPSEAEQAITKLSGQEILGRKVSVQLARKPEPNSEKHDGNGEGSGGEGTRRRHSGRGRGRGRGRGSRGGRAGREDGANEEGSEELAVAGDAITGEVQPLADITNQDNSEHGKGKQARPQRERRERGPPADGIPSKTKVMVANLPYELTEEKLKELFTKYEPSSAKIALRPIPRFMIKKLQARGEQRKGRGFGFVTLVSEEMQQKAVEEMNGKEIEGREIAVKVAIDSPDKTDDHEHIELNEHAERSEGTEQVSNGTLDAPPAAAVAPSAVSPAAAVVPSAVSTAAPVATAPATAAVAPAA